MTRPITLTADERWEAFEAFVPARTEWRRRAIAMGITGRAFDAWADGFQWWRSERGKEL